MRISHSFCIWFYPLNMIFFGNTFGEIKEFEKLPLNTPNKLHKGLFFLENRHILTPNCDSQESSLAAKMQSFFRVFLVTQVYITSIPVAPSQQCTDQQQQYTYICCPSSMLPVTLLCCLLAHLSKHLRGSVSEVASWKQTVGSYYANFRYDTRFRIESLCPRLNDNYWVKK